MMLSRNHHLVHFEDERKELETRLRADLGNAADTAISGDYDRQYLEAYSTMTKNANDI